MRCQLYDETFINAVCVFSSMKKSVVALFCLLCVSFAFAQSYPVPTLVEGTVPGFITEYPGIQPMVTQPAAFVPEKYKRACTVDCLLAYKRCVRDGGSMAACRSTEYYACVESCPAPNERGGPEVAFPAQFPGRSACMQECRTAYNFCIGEGGDVNTCSQRVLNPCAQDCAEEFASPTIEQPVPPGLSCTNTCEFKFRQCRASGTAGCGAVKNSCLRECSGYAPPEPEEQVPQSMPPERSCGQQCGAGFEECRAAGTPLYQCQNSVIACLNGCGAGQPAPVPVTPATPMNAEQNVEPVVVQGEPSFWERVRIFFFGE